MDTSKHVEDLNKIVDSITDLQLFPPILWVMIWDIIRDSLDDQDYTTNFTQQQIFDMLYASAEEQGFTLQFGMDHLYEHVHDWLLENDILVSVDEEDGE